LSKLQSSELQMDPHADYRDEGFKSYSKLAYDIGVFTWDFGVNGDVYSKLIQNEDANIEHQNAVELIHATFYAIKLQGEGCGNLVSMTFDGTEIEVIGHNIGEGEAPRGGVTLRLKPSE